MNPALVRERVEAIHAETWSVFTKSEGGTWDDEAAHSREDDLYEDLLRAIADGTCEDPAACAKEALRTKDYDFARWCA